MVGSYVKPEITVWSECKQCGIPIVPSEESMSECAVSEVIEILVKELDNHGYGDMHWFPLEYRDPSVEAALSVGRAWLAAHQRSNPMNPGTES